LGKVLARVEDGRGITVIAIDEMSEILKSPLMREFVYDSLPQLRKHRGVLIMATQYVDQLIRRNVLSDVVQSCPTVLILANPKLDRAQYAEVFKLNPAECDQVMLMQTQRQIGIKRGLQPLMVVDLHLDQAALARYSHTHSHQPPVAGPVLLTA
jgi:type IV secretory pathway VirB4 component